MSASAEYDSPFVRLRAVGLQYANGTVALRGVDLDIRTGESVVVVVAHWQPVFDPSPLLVPLLGAVAFGVLGGIPPAITASRIQPADAVRS